MGWGRMLLLGNVGQQLDIGDLESAIGEMQNAVREKDETDLNQTRRSPWSAIQATRTKPSCVPSERQAPPA